MDEDATWYGSRPQPRPHCIRRGPSSAWNGHSSPPHLFGPCLLWPRLPISATAEHLLMSFNKLQRFTYISIKQSFKSNSHNTICHKQTRNRIKNLKITHHKLWVCNTVHQSADIKLCTTTTTTPQPFYALFPGPPGWAGTRIELLDFMVQGKINRGRHTDHPDGHHSNRTNQCPPPLPPNFFTGRMPFLLPNQQYQSTEGYHIHCKLSNV